MSGARQLATTSTGQIQFLGHHLENVNGGSVREIKTLHQTSICIIVFVYAIIDIFIDIGIDNRQSNVCALCVFYTHTTRIIIVIYSMDFWWCVC